MIGDTMTTLTDRLPGTADPDTLYEIFSLWAQERGLSLYPHQEEALIEIVSGANVILNTPTGSGKSLVATAAHFAALARNGTTFYTAPIKALVSEKFFALIEIFGAENVGMLTGDARSTRTRRSSAVRPRSWRTSRCARARTRTSARW